MKKKDRDEEEETDERQKRKEKERYTEGGREMRFEEVTRKLARFPPECRGSGTPQNSPKTPSQPDRKGEKQL